MSDDPADEADESGERAPAGESGGDESAVSGSDPGPGIPSDDPFADYDTPSGDPFESGTGAFDTAGGPTADPDEVWDRLAGGGDSDAATGPREDVADVSKHDFCERCEFFSPPPDVDCSHEGTEIVEFRDMETVRVVDCPVVAERRRLDGLDE